MGGFGPCPEGCGGLTGAGIAEAVADWGAGRVVVGRDIGGAGAEAGAVGTGLGTGGRSEMPATSPAGSQSSGLRSCVWPAAARHRSRISVNEARPAGSCQVQFGGEPAARVSQRVITGLGEDATWWLLLQVALLASSGRVLVGTSDCGVDAQVPRDCPLRVGQGLEPSEDPVPRCRPAATGGPGHRPGSTVRTRWGRPATEHRSGPGTVCRRSVAAGARRAAALPWSLSATTAPAPHTARP